MLSILGGVGGKIVFWLLDMWMRKQKLKEKSIKQYYAFMDEMNKYTSFDLSQYSKAQTSRLKTKARIKARRKKASQSAEKSEVKTIKGLNG